MASRGRKRKAEAALAAAAEKREKPAGSREGEVAGPSVVIEHCLCPWCYWSVYDGTWPNFSHVPEAVVSSPPETMVQL
ncbi:hypothetical protein MJG53_010736 [Ovis ammon polii x Ovis aries]|uniref:Uncharacterized protein n=2 Tax=Ovis TaxID=9935 RepID=A0A836CV85_SHEEP|nr:hypothetical protein JEQ12_006649 [Ovis aries]KAI4581194.1 hypothetical protein MJG53_010736 [Ovis ammon polii x Ovis aries]